MLVIAISILGAVLNVWFLKDSGIAPITWCLFPYIVSGGLSPVAKEQQPWKSALVGATVLMDAAFFIETAAGQKTTLLLILSLLSTLKLLTTFPAGAFIGYALYKLSSSYRHIHT